MFREFSKAPELRLHAPSVTRRFASGATSPVSLRYTGQEQARVFSLLPRNAGEVARRALARRDGGGVSPPHSSGDCTDG